MNKIVFGENLKYIKSIKSESINLIYIDPPFNTGKVQSHTRIKTIRDLHNGDRIGFNGIKYKTISMNETSYIDIYSDYIGFLRPRIEEAYRILSSNGSLFFHIDYRESHYCKIMLDEIFGRDSFINEIIWSYDYGARSKNKWPTKHDNIFWYAKDPEDYIFNYDEIDRIPYMAPGLVGKEKAARGKTPTDVWWNTIVCTNGSERTGYVTQKPIAILDRIIKVHSNKKDLILDFFAGSGTAGESAAKNDRKFLLVDNNIEAIKIMMNRLNKYKPEIIICADDITDKSNIGKYLPSKIVDYI